MSSMRLLLALLLIASPVLHAKLEGRRPNIVFVLTDDQGYGDLSVHGNPVLKTPNLDAMHAQSLRFTNWFNSPTCAPTRSALLTGRHEFRNGITHTIYERERLTLSATTLAQVLKGAGYTTGIFGKWHLGDEAEYQPGKRGFDEVFLHGAGGIGQTYPGSCGDAPGNSYFDPYILHNGTFEHTKGYCTDVFFTQAKHWIEEQKDKPFFCWLATNAPHAPYIAKPEDEALYTGKTPGKESAAFFGMLHNIDQNMGALLKQLDDLKLSENTLVVFMNDNGGTAGVPVFNAGMRAAKGTPWLGGTRGISFWRWPGTLQPADCGALTAHIDFFRTASALAGVDLSQALQDQSAEGRSLLPLMGNPAAAWEDRYLFTHVGRWPKGSDPDAAKLQNCAVRNQQYTLVRAAGNARGNGKAAARADWQLFDVLADPTQSKNLAVEKPEVVSQLSTEYDRWWASLKGQYDVHEATVGPKLNPYAELFWKQYGGGPKPEDYERMDPAKAFSTKKPAVH
jgi:arylsulfatase A-like enzyme